MTSKNIDALRASFEVWNKRDLKKAASAYSENAAVVNHGREITYKGRDQIVGSWDELVKGFPDAEVTDLNYYDAGDTIVTTFVGRGTNKGEMMGMPSTGRRVSTPICLVSHFDAKGLIDREDQYSDSFSLLVQLGHAKAPVQA
ncbi:MAG: ester cyclase [Actinomycetota bacterium]